MAKRTRGDETPFNPVDAIAVRGLLAPAANAPDSGQAPPEVKEAAAPTEDAQAKSTRPEPRRSKAREGKAAATRRRRRSEEKPEAAEEELGQETDAPAVERMTKPKRVLLTQTEAWDFDNFVHALSGAARLKIPYSHLMRVLMGIAISAEEEIAKEVEQLGTLSLPANADALSVAEFENKIETALRRGLAQNFKRRTRPL